MTLVRAAGAVVDRRSGNAGAPPATGPQAPSLLPPASVGNRRDPSGISQRMRTTVLSAACLVLAWAAPAIVGATSCTGDCSAAGAPTGVDLAATVEIALAREALDACEAADWDGDGLVTVEEVVRAVRFSLDGCPSQLPPTSAADLFAWLGEGDYLDWRAESQVHASVGPHFGRVRTFVNDAVLASLEGGEVSHPIGAALVKELYGSGGSDVRGWSVMVKTQDDSAGGTGWYWYERFGSSTFASSNVAPGCYGCHGDPPYPAITSKDYVLTPFPLQ